MLPGVPEGAAVLSVLSGFTLKGRLLSFHFREILAVRILSLSGRSAKGDRYAFGFGPTPLFELIGKPASQKGNLGMPSPRSSFHFDD